MKAGGSKGAHTTDRHCDLGTESAQSGTMYADIFLTQCICKTQSKLAP